MSEFDPFFEKIREIVREEVAAQLKGSKDDRLLTVEQVCEILNVAKPWVYHNVKKLPFVRKVGGNLRFSSTDLQRWILAQRLKSAKEGS